MAFRTTLAAVALIACTAAAQTAAEQSPPYEGQVTTRDVYVRSSPGGYECIKLHAPAKVQVIARAYDWLKIAPPARCYSLLAKQYVTASADGKSGTVTGDSVRVRAGSELKPTRVGVIQTHLNIGDKVVILGEQKARNAGQEMDF